MGFPRMFTIDMLLLKSMFNLFDSANISLIFSKMLLNSSGGHLYLDAGTVPSLPFISVIQIHSTGTFNWMIVMTSSKVQFFISYKSHMIVKAKILAQD